MFRRLSIYFILLTEEDCGTVETFGHLNIYFYL